MAGRPLVLSRVAHTTMWVAREPAVTKIFSPLMTYSSPSSLAVVVTAAESEPKPGSVMAMAAHTLPNLSASSLVVTLDTAALPSPWKGMVSSRPQSPQLISRAFSSADMLAPLTFCFSVFSSARKASAPAKANVPAAVTPANSVSRVSSSTG
ncbi:Uncharacterised protein [Mycobacteroides abscessus subsp. massiliense]|nr:Uncharacterised protein [Mycobacteroides abscessus subsp. massiliense]